MMYMKAGITVKFRELINIIKDGFKGIARHFSMAFASIISILSVLLILSTVLIIVLSVNKVVGDTKEKINEVKVFLLDGVDDAGIKELEGKIKDIDGVKNVKFISKDEGLESMFEQWDNKSYLLEEYKEDNPLPNAFKVNVEDIEKIIDVAANIKLIPGVEDVRFLSEEVIHLLKISKYMQIGGFGLIVALIFISIFLISNTIKLSISSRKKEIEIMKYVGATNSYITGPYVFEGILIGLIAAVLAIMVVKFGYSYIYEYIVVSNSSLLNEAIVSPDSILDDFSIIFITLSVGIGMLGSIGSLKKLLKV